MTQANPFLEILKSSPHQPDDRAPALNVLRQVAGAIADYSAGRLTCDVVEGHPTNFGQEFRVVIRSARTGYEHVMLRAYIPLLGRPIRLDLYDFEMAECPDVAAMQTALERFVAKSTTRDAIDAYSR